MNFSISLAFRDIVEKTSARKFNCIFLDEVLDVGLDEQGIKDGIRILADFAKTSSTYVISHRQEIIENFDSLIYIDKEGSFTKITEELNG